MVEKMQFYPLDINYKIIEGKPVIFLFGKTIDKKQVCVVDESFRPYFIVIPKIDITELAEKIRKISLEEEKETINVLDIEKAKMKKFGKEAEILKVYTQLPSHIPKIKDIIKEWNIIEGVYEYDILFTRRYLIDKGIIPMTLTEAEGEFANYRLRVPSFRAESIKSVSDEALDSPKVLAIDIETYNPPDNIIDSKQNPIIMLAMYGKRFSKVITWKAIEGGDLPIEHVNSEAELIEKFKEHIEAYSPDIITGYFSDGFDLPYIKDRAHKYKIKLDIGLDYSEISVDKKGESAAEIAGIVHIDLLKFIRKIMARGINFENYKLNTVAAQLIGEKKDQVEIEDLHIAWDTNDKKKLAEFCKYNLQDAALCYKLFDKAYPQLIEMIKIVGQAPFSLSRMSFSQLVEWYLLRQAHLHNEIAPNKPSHFDLQKRHSQSYTGAFVFQPKPGLYKNVVIFDFRSLYPSIISSHNIDIGTLNAEEHRENNPNTITLEDTGETFWFSTKKKGFLSSLIEEIITRRSRVKEMMKKDKDNPLLDARQNSLKLLANSFYGYLGFSMARWYSIECAKAVTAFGRFHIKKVIHEAKEKGFNVLYSDTDSVFLELGDKKKKDSIDFMDEINSKLPGIMELEYEGFYPSAIFVSAKAEGTGGAKKRYAIISEDGKIKIKGFETVRRNFSKIGKQVQMKVLEIILKENDKEKALKYVKEKIKQLRDHEIPVDKLIISTQLTKDVGGYGNVGPHVSVAQKMIQKGINVSAGSTIRYVIAKGPGLIRDKAKLPNEITQDEYDAEYYLNHQIIPAVEKLFEVLGYKKEDLVAEHDQRDLKSFFG